MRYFFLFIIFSLLLSCNGGLEPPPNTDGIVEGVIRYSGGVENWPEDSVNEVRIIAFKEFPPQDFLGAVLSGQAYFTDPLPLYGDSTNFSFTVEDAPIEIQYIAVVQNYGTLFEWRPIGVYTETGNIEEHSKLFVEQGTSYTISINVDFENLPPNPLE